jgi:hypothetical protein
MVDRVEASIAASDDAAASTDPPMLASGCDAPAESQKYMKKPQAPGRAGSTLTAFDSQE